MENQAAELIAEIQDRLDHLARLGIYASAIVTTGLAPSVKIHGDPHRPERRQSPRPPAGLLH